VSTIVPEIPNRKLLPKTSLLQRSVKLDEDILQTLVEQNPIVTVEELAEKLGFGH